ncbi:MAG TPA: efflux RND transporter periplasmic adaptor subunit [Dissulfurispiraceae bacterium]|nr:efflux RND transporter periplasmic adaptor subunit [Dissulfurispiraceae bacterium]
MTRRMLIMLVAVGLLFGGIFGYKAFKSHMANKAMAGMQAPPVAVSAIKAELQQWQPQLKAVGSLRAVRGVDVTSEISGLVRTLHFKSGDRVKEGQLLVQLNADSDMAQLRSLEAAAELANTVYERDKKQYDAKAISKAALDADAADLKVKRAQVAQQSALVDKKTIRAPFGGQLGISIVNPGQYLNPGDKIVTLQSLDSIYIDFYLPQQELSRISLGQKVVAVADTYPGRTFIGKITSINPKVDPDTRNVQVEATIINPRHELLPGMYASVEVQAGAPARYLTLPLTAVAFNPYGETIFIVEEKGKGADGKPVLIARQSFVTTGETRGDQVAILKGIKEGDIVVTGGQLKLKNGSVVIIDNRVQPGNEAAPKPVDE